MAYVVYVNHPNNKATVHNTDCGKYVARKREKTINGYWTEEFSALDDALEHAHSTEKARVDTCAFCT